MKKVISIAAAFLFLAVPLQAMAFFSDVTTSHRNYDAINYVYTNDIVSGYSDGTYRPDNLINRAEFVKILVASKFKGPLEGSMCFPDVTRAWYAGYVCYALDNKILAGYPDGTFRPDKQINLAEALKMVLESYKYKFSDVASPWYQKYLDYAQAHNYLTKINAGVGDYITRGEMAQLIYNIEYSPPASMGTP